MIDSNELTRKIKTTLNPKAVMIAYASEDDRNFFLEIREIDDRGNMTEGRPVTVQFMNALVKDTRKDTAPLHTGRYPPTCCIATRAKVAKDTCGTIPRTSG